MKSSILTHYCKNYESFKNCDEPKERQAILILHDESRCYSTLPELLKFNYIDVFDSNIIGSTYE
jgi:hypothetical protein